MKIKVNPESDWYSVGNYQRVFEMASPFSICYNEQNPHLFWTQFNDPYPDSIMEKQQDRIVYTLMVEKQLLMALGVQVNDWEPALINYPEIDFKSIMDQFLLLIEQTNPKWVEPGGEVAILSESDEVLRNYVTYINWLHHWLRTYVEDGTLIIE